MKLTELLDGVGRPVAYYPKLRKITKSTTATIFVCQLIYWTGKEAAGDGWIYKTSEEIEEETGLSYDEQRTARGHLVKSGILEERNARLEHKMYYRINKQRMDELWESEIPEMGNAKFGKAAMPSSTESTLPSSLNSNTENTKEYNQALPLDWKIASGEPITDEDIKTVDDRTQALTSIERAFGVSQWPWSSNVIWTKFERFVITCWKRNPKVWDEYVAWASDPHKGKFKAYSARKIRENPQPFMDTGMPEFEASKMYAKKPELELVY